MGAEVVRQLALDLISAFLTGSLTIFPSFMGSLLIGMSWSHGSGVVLREDQEEAEDEDCCDWKEEVEERRD